MADAPEPLKPCPFCGSAAHVATIPENWGYTHEELVISCSNMQCPVAPKVQAQTQEWAPGKGTYSIKAQTTAKLHERWNTRA